MVELRRNGDIEGIMNDRRRAPLLLLLLALVLLPLLLAPLPRSRLLLLPPLLDENEVLARRLRLLAGKMRLVVRGKGTSVFIL
jgi:hypothetical protein